jgi:hypothetical protein
MTARWYPWGALAGATVGAAARGGFTYYNLVAAAAQVGVRDAALTGLASLALLPSAGIGLLCGAIAGAFGRPAFGSALGAALSAGVFALFVLPFSCCLSAFQVEKLVWDFSSLFFVQKAIAGALAGGVGGFVGRLSAQGDRQGPPARPAAERSPDGL